MRVYRCRRHSRLNQVVVLFQMGLHWEYSCWRRCIEFVRIFPGVLLLSPLYFDNISSEDKQWVH